jgi:hypothetical protein
MAKQEETEDQRIKRLVDERIDKMIASGSIPTPAGSAQPVSASGSRGTVRRPMLNYHAAATDDAICKRYDTSRGWKDVAAAYESIKRPDGTPDLPRRNAYVTELRERFAQLRDPVLRDDLLERLQTL